MPSEACSRGFALAAFATGLLILAMPCAAATIEVTVSGVAPNGGNVLASLCAGGLDSASCGRGQSQPAADSALTFLFPDVEPGRYAAIAFQDIVGDGLLRRSRMGRPLEPYGLSNGAGRSRHPTFEQAAVRVGQGGARIAIRLDRGAP